jgi:putative peptidoglycan binding protein
MNRPVLAEGDFGADVGILQECVGAEFDRDFGPATKSAVMDYQRRNNLDVDGKVGDETWSSLESTFALPPYPPKLYALPQDQIDTICEIAANSEIARYDWEDRGVAPPGYIKGMAIAYAIAFTRLREEDPIAEEMARGENGDDDTDALAWYAPEFRALGMHNESDGIDTLRHLYVLMMGLGMRESSGGYCVGRDTSADNTSSTTAEAGLFQMSWNASVSSISMLGLFDAYDVNGNDTNGYEFIFEEGVTCSESNWANYGSGDGERYQWMAKNFPLFACETAAIGLRALRAHWGPISRKEVELREEADHMFMLIEDAIDGGPQPEPEPVASVTIKIDPPGSVRVAVDGAQRQR